MNRRPILKITLFAGAAALLTSMVGGLAWAHGKGAFGDRHKFMKNMVTQRIDDALDYAKVDGEPRQKIHAIRDRLFTEFEANRGSHMEKLAKAKELFLADNVDKAAIAAFREEQQKKMQKMGDVIEESFLEAHDALTREQREKIVEYVEKHRPGRFHDEE